MRVAIGEIVIKCKEHANIFEQGDSRSRKGDHDEDGNKVLLGQNDKSWWLHRLPRTPLGLHPCQRRPQFHCSPCFHWSAWSSMLMKRFVLRFILKRVSTCIESLEWICITVHSWPQWMQHHLPRAALHGTTVDLRASSVRSPLSCAMIRDTGKYPCASISCGRTPIMMLSLKLIYVASLQKALSR